MKLRQAKKIVRNSRRLFVWRLYRDTTWIKACGVVDRHQRMVPNETDESIQLLRRQLRKEAERMGERHEVTQTLP